MINEERGFMMKINNMIPKNAKYIIFNLCKYSREAYLVGGCVRDILLDRQPNDWDICTPAKPEQMIHIMETVAKRDNKNIKIIPTGLQHGTVTFVIDGESYEVTTYRCDGIYSDNRRPDNVTFTNSLVEDLKRRDFTINAIAYNTYSGFVDPFNGIQDLKDGVIKCVGNPKDRFNEDGLRIMRAIRFSAQLDFYIENKTVAAIIDSINNLDNISAERINSELCKILVSNHPETIMSEHILCKIIPEFKPCINFPQHNPYHIFNVFDHILMALNRDNSNDLIIRLALLFHDIGKPYSYQDDEDGTRHFKGHGKVSSELTDKIMKRLKFDNETREKVVKLVRYHDATFEANKKHVKRWLNRIGEEQFRRLLKVRIADILAQSSINRNERLQKIYMISNLLNKVLIENECFSLKNLTINGKDLIEIGYKEGKLIGIILQDVLNNIIEENLNNDKTEILAYVKEKFSNEN